MTTTVQEFQTHLSHLHSDLYDSQKQDLALLSRFLRARNNNLEKATTMFVQAQEWRNKEKVGDIGESFVFEEREKVSQIWPRLFHGQDRKGRPILINLHSSLDANKLFAITTEERLLKSFIREQEKLVKFRFPACPGGKVEQVVLILDCKGYPYLQFHRIAGIVHKITRISSDYYPESLGRIFIINAPFMFPSIWAIARKFFDEETAAKITIVGTDYLSALEEEIDRNNIPRFLNGGCEDCPEGCENSDKGPWKNAETDHPLWDFSLRDKGGDDSAVSI